MMSDPDHLSIQVAKKPAILAIILVSYIMIVLDVSIVLAALPRMQAELGFSAGNLAWVQSAYTLTFGGFLLLGARAGDILGRRLMLICGLLIFILASLAVGSSVHAAYMLVYRACQGFGAAILAPSTLALLQTTFPEGHERTRAISLYSAAAGLGATIGLIIGGILTQYLSWRVGFYINLPIGFCLLIATYTFVDETQKHDGRFDVAGAVMATLAMTILVYGLIRSASSGWLNEITLALIVGAFLLLYLFVIIEQKVQQPILPMRLFASIQRSGAYAARVLYLGTVVGFFFYMTIYLQKVMGYSPALTGFAFIPATILHFPFAVAFPYLLRRFGSCRLLIAGGVFGITGMSFLSLLSASSLYFPSIALPMVLIGLSQGLTISPLTSSGVAGVDLRDAGAASGVVNVAHQFGGSLGLSIVVAASSIGDNKYTGIEGVRHQFSMAMYAGTLMMTCAFIIVYFTIILPSLRSSRC